MISLESPFILLLLLYYETHVFLMFLTSHNCHPEERVFRNTAKKLCSLRQIPWDMSETTFAKHKTCQFCTDYHLTLECPFVVEMNRQLCQCEGCLKLADYSGRCGMCSANCSLRRCLMKETDLSTIEPEYLCYFEDDREEILQILQSKTCCNTEDNCKKFIVGKDNLFCTECEKQMQKYLRCYVSRSKSSNVLVSDLVHPIDQNQTQIQEQDLNFDLNQYRDEYRKQYRDEDQDLDFCEQLQEQLQNDIFDLLEDLEYEEQNQEQDQEQGQEQGQDD